MEKYCKNHPNRLALSTCHTCGESYCRECLIDGKEYYYCKAPTCLTDDFEPAGLTEYEVRKGPGWQCYAAGIISFFLGFGIVSIMLIRGRKWAWYYIAVMNVVCPLALFCKFYTEEEPTFLFGTACSLMFLSLVLLITNPPWKWIKEPEPDVKTDPRSQLIIPISHKKWF